MAATFTEADLGQFIGTENYFSHPLFPSCVYSDGCSFLMKNGAAWLVEAVMSHLQANKAFRAKMAKNPGLRGMSFWDCKLNGKGGATLTCVEDEGRPVACKQEIEFTDLPFDMRLWVQATQWLNAKGQPVTGWLVHLPSEY
jgi:hypothetical protein